MRKLHKYSAYVVALPLSIILITGFFLLLRKDLPFMSGGDPKFKVESFSNTSDVFSVLDSRYGLKETDVSSISLSLSKGTYSVKDNNSIQYVLRADNLETVAKRGPNSFRKIIFSIHEGTFFGPIGLYFVWLPTLIATIILTISGLYFLFYKKF